MSDLYDELENAIEQGNLQLIDELIAQGARTSLWSIYRMDFKTVKHLVDNHKDMLYVDCEEWSFQHMDTRSVLYVIDNGIVSVEELAAMATCFIPVGVYTAMKSMEDFVRRRYKRYIYYAINSGLLNRKDMSDIAKDIIVSDVFGEKGSLFECDFESLVDEFGECVYDTIYTKEDLEFHHFRNKSLGEIRHVPLQSVLDEMNKLEDKKEAMKLLVGRPSVVVGYRDEYRRHKLIGKPYGIITLQDIEAFPLPEVTKFTCCSGTELLF